MSRVGFLFALVRLACFGAMAGFGAIVGCGTDDPSPETGAAADLERSQLLTHAGDWDAAAEALLAARRAGADTVAVALGMAQVNIARGRHEAAARDLAMLPPAARQLPLYMVLRAWMMHAVDGRALDARDAAQQVLDRYPESIEARLLLARLALQATATMDLTAAQSLCVGILAAAPGHREAGRMLVETELRRGHFAAAAEAGRQQTAMLPEDGYLWLLIGTANLWARDLEDAIDALHRAADLAGESNTDRQRVLWLLHLAHQARGDDPGDIEPRYRFLPYATGQPPEAVPRFVNVAAALGVDKVDRGRGSAWLDYDGDGDWDLFTVGIHTPHALYRNDRSSGGGDMPFVDSAPGLGMTDLRGGWGASAADCDDDGDPDLFVTRDAWEGRAPNSLYRNDGEAFVDVAETAGVAGQQASFTAAWGDYDGDGRLDLYVANGVIADGGANSLHLNRTGGAILFEDIATAAGVADTLKTVGTAAGDYDADGRVDLYSVNIGGPNRLFHNLGAGVDARVVFEDVAQRAGVLFPLEGGYVTFFLDFNNDGHLDLFVSIMSSFEDVLHSIVQGRAIEPNRPFLYRNEGDGTFTDVAVPAGLGRSFGTMGAGVGDVDNDGFPDLYLANGGPKMYRLEANTLFLNSGDGTFADVTTIAGVGDLGKGHGATFADYDADGDLDLYAGLGGHYDGDVWPNALYRNDGPGGRSLTVRALDGRHDAVGARLRVVLADRSPERSIYGNLASGYGFGSSNAPTFVAGLGDAEAHRLEVVWSGGQRQVWDVPPGVTGVQVRRGRPDLEPFVGDRTP